MQTKTNYQTMSKTNLMNILRDVEAGTVAYEAVLDEFARRRALEPVYPTIETQLAFISVNNPTHEQYKIKEIFESCFDKALSNALPYTYFSHGCNYLLKGFKVNYFVSIADNVKAFEAYVIELGVTIADFKLFFFTHTLFTYYYFRPLDNGKAKEGEYTNLAQFLLCLNNGSMTRDFKEANDFLDAAKVTYNNKNSYEYKMGNLSVKRFNNGRIDIKGLTPVQESVITRCLAIHTTLRNKI